MVFSFILTACGGGGGSSASSAPTLSGITLSGNLNTSSAVTGKKYLNGDNDTKGGSVALTPLTTKSLGASWTPGTSGLSVSVSFIEDSTGTTKHTGTVDASVGSYSVTYTLAGSTDANDVYNWPDGKYRIVVTPAGGSATTLEVWKDTVAPTNTVNTIDGTAVVAGTVFTVNGHRDITMVGSCGADTVSMLNGGPSTSSSFDATTHLWTVNYIIGDWNVVYVPGFYCVDDAGNYGGLSGFAGVMAH